MQDENRMRERSVAECELRGGVDVATARTETMVNERVRDECGASAGGNSAGREVLMT